MFLPALAYYVIFCYAPMYGAIIAFKNFIPGRGIWNSAWVGLKHFEYFFNGMFFGRLMRNTFLLNLYDVIFGFPAPIILAILLHELRGVKFKTTVQTTFYMPYFVSMVVVCGIIMDFVATEGVVNDILAFFGMQPRNLLQDKSLFRPIFVATNIWQFAGWTSIIYIAALGGINQEFYDAAYVDGCGRFKRVLHVTLPGLRSIIVIMLILRLGNMMTVGFEKVILLYNPLTYETADVIASYVFRKGLLEGDYSFATAIGLFNSVINFMFLIAANWYSRKLSEDSLW